MVQVEVRREYAPDRKAMVEALRCVLRKATAEVEQPIALRAHIRGPTGGPLSNSSASESR
jgi:hypothetical protein